MRGEALPGIKIDTNFLIIEVNLFDYYLNTDFHKIILIGVNFYSGKARYSTFFTAK